MSFASFSSTTNMAYYRAIILSGVRGTEPLMSTPATIPPKCASDWEKIGCVAVLSGDGTGNPADPKTAQYLVNLATKKKMLVAGPYPTTLACESDTTDTSYACSINISNSVSHKLVNPKHEFIWDGTTHTLSDFSDGGSIDQSSYCAALKQCTGKGPNAALADAALARRRPRRRRRGRHARCAFPKSSQLS